MAFLKKMKNFEKIGIFENFAIFRKLENGPIEIRTTREKWRKFALIATLI